ncbi:MAG: Gfo/Idh/MocA family protein [Bacteroidia bacterium]
MQIDKRKVDLVMVGCGAMGRNIAQAVKMFPEWQLSGLFDLNEIAVKRVKNEILPSATIATDYDHLLELLPSGGILVIATTAKSHEMLFNKAIEKGVKKIFLEKPITTSLAAASRMIQLARENQVLVNVDHVRRWIAPVEGIKRILDSGTLGKIHGMNYTFGRSGFAMIGTHIFDLSRWLFDSDIDKLRGELDDIIRQNWRGTEFIDQSGRCEFLHENGIRVHLDLSDNLEIQQDYFVITGSKGRLEVDQRLQTIRLAGGAGRIWEYPFQWFDSFHNGLASSLYELASGKKPKCSLEDGMKALEATIAVHKSQRSDNSWVKLPLNGDIIEETFPFA